MPSQNKIKCSKCGEDKGTTNVRYAALVKQFGSEKKLLAEYTCRSCKSGNKPKPKKVYTKKAKKTKVKSKKLLTSKIICSKCNGKFGTTKARTEKLIAKFGSLEAVQANYVCRTCRKQHNVDARGKTKPVKQKRKEKIQWQRDKEGTIILPNYLKVTERSPRPADPVSLGQSNTCWRPDIWCTNGRFCDGPVTKCPHYLQPSCGAKQVHCPSKKNKEKKSKKTKKKA